MLIYTVLRELKQIFTNIIEEQGFPTSKRGIVDVLDTVH